jgi:hypothetical protein
VLNTVKPRYSRLTLGAGTKEGRRPGGFASTLAEAPLLLGLFTAQIVLGAAIALKDALTTKRKSFGASAR